MHTSHSQDMQATGIHRVYTIVLFSIFILLSVLSSTEMRAQGNLIITPRRLVFDGKKKTQVLDLANTGKDTATFLISMMEIRMDKNGKFEKIATPDSGQNFASSYLRFNPRTVTLAPNEAQTVRVQISKPGLLQPGEYRSHLYVRADPDGMRHSVIARSDSSGISVTMVPVFGISVPVIIRMGTSTTEVAISDLKTIDINDTAAVLTMVFNRTGNMSSYGDLKVDFIADNGKTTQVAIIKGLAVYAPTSSRFMRVDLVKKHGINYHSGKLHILYTTPADEKSLKIAETELALH